MCKKLLLFTLPLFTISLNLLLGSVIDPDVNLNVTSEQLEKLFLRIQEEWTQFGSDDPYWSVLTHDKFKMNTIDQKMKNEFYESGKGDFDVLQAYCTKHHIPLPKGRCLELGCGVGRVTHYLAKHFDHVDAVDISAPHLRLCDENLKAQRISNFTPIWLNNFLNFKTQLGEYDCFYSVIVLQHNPPPVQQYMLSLILSKIAPGGICLFQIPTSLDGYKFNCETYFATEKNMEIHCLPLHVIIDLLTENNFSIIDIQRDNALGTDSASCSRTFFVRKKNES